MFIATASAHTYVSQSRRRKCGNDFAKGLKGTRKL